VLEIAPARAIERHATMGRFAAFPARMGREPSAMQGTLKSSAWCNRSSFSNSLGSSLLLKLENMPKIKWAVLLICSSMAE